MYFVILKNTNNKYWWRVVADGNHETLASSELLENKDSCFNAIRIIANGAAQATVYDRT